MSLLLHIETSGRICSIALAQKGQLVGYKESRVENSHAEILTVLIEQLLATHHFTLAQLKGIAISEGPGSYTGLRIGTSAAKGLAYALDIPLIAISTLQAMTYGIPDITDAHTLLCPMIDARRMEVYTAVYSKNRELISDIHPLIIEEDSFDTLRQNNSLILFGDGANKCKPLLGHKNITYIEDILPCATFMIKPAYEKYLCQEVVDTAYFEPFYLKEFIGGKPTVKGLK